MKTAIYLSYPAALCAAGNSPEEIWHSAITGNQSGIQKTHTLSNKDFYVGKIASSALSSTTDKNDCRIIQIVNAAISQLEPKINQLKEKYGSSRIGVCVGSCDNSSETSLFGHEKYFENGSFDSSYNLEKQSAYYPATFIANKFGITGPSSVFATACSSSANAIIKASELIRSGIVDVAIAGGVDLASDTAVLGFDSLEAVSDSVSNPFSKNRSGITLGEGAAFFVLSKESTDVEEKTNPTVALLGFGQSSDASHMTAPLADGTGASRAIKSALLNASLSETDIDYVNLHGTGTHLNDSMEAKAIKISFPNTFETLPVSSTKPIMGHTLGAAGALELMLCYMSIVKNDKKSLDKIKLPLHKWDGEREDEMPKLNFVSEKTKATKRIKTCMSNSFAFGGCNISLIIGEKNV